MDRLREFFQNLNARLQTLSTPQKIFYSGSLLVLIGSLAFLFYTVNKVEYASLYSKMSEEDLGGVVEALKAKKIPYELTSSNSISVPKERLHEVRLALATDGVLKGSGLGFEIFDQQKLGSTEFVQKINYQRALQGELSRTINRMNEIEESRVHLVLPSDSLFIEDQKPPSAAVVLKLRSGAKLEPQQVQGIVNLVAGSIQGLTDDKITVLSTDGQVLFKKNAADNTFQMTNVQMQFKGNVEEDLRRKVLAMLEPVVGVNRALARISTDLDFSHVQVSEDRYDPDSAVIRSQQRSTESTQGGELGAKGNPDVPINVESKLMQSPPQPGQQQKVASRQKETVNYEITHTTRQITQAPGSIKKLSVAVIVDGPYEMQPNGEGKPVPTFVARSPEQIKALEDIVKKAVGYNEGRGDQITVSNIPFVTDGIAGELEKADDKWVRMLKDNQRLIFNLLLTILAFFFIVRPFMRKFQKLGEEPKALPEGAAAGALPEGEAGADQQVLLEDKADELTLRKQAISLVQQNPEQAAAIIRAMIREEG
jgi:flagellar M-ring protein FliF